VRILLVLIVIEVFAFFETAMAIAAIPPNDRAPTHGPKTAAA
jgi:hypothetical protein